MFCGRAFVARLLQLQRTDAEEIAGRADQRRAAPVGMRRRGEDRFVEHVFPITGEFLLGDDACGDRVLPPAGAAKDDALADRSRRRLPEFERRHVELGERLHQAEAGFLIVAEHVAGHRTPVAQRQPDRVRLGDQIADGQDEAIAANDDAVTGALGAERFRRERVRRHGCAQRHHTGQGLIEIEGIILRLRLHGGRHLPVAHGRHLTFLRSGRGRRHGAEAKPKGRRPLSIPRLLIPSCRTPHWPFAAPQGASRVPAGSARVRISPCRPALVSSPLPSGPWHPAKSRGVACRD